MHKFKTVFMFEYTNFIKSKAYIVVSVIFLILIAGVGSLPAILKGVDAVKTMVAGDNKDTDATETLPTAFLIDNAGLYDDETLAAYLPPYTWERHDAESAAEAIIENGDATLVLAIDGLHYNLYLKGEDLMSGGLPGVDEMISAVERQQALYAHGLTDEDILELESAVPVATIIPVGKDISQSFWLAYAILFLLYMTTIMYGQNVLMSVVTEKSSKAMELLVTSATPMELMFGKVLGTGLAGLTQFGMIMLTAGLSIRLNLDGWMAMSPAVGAILSLSLSGGLFAYAIIFFLLGFFTFAFIYAGVGSTVSRMEEAGSVTTLPVLLFVAAFLVAMMGLSSPGAAWVRICSFAPFLSPMVMFMRICTTNVAFLEIILVIALNLAYMFGAGFVAARIYRVGVLMYGKAPKLKDILKYIVRS